MLRKKRECSGMHKEVERKFLVLSAPPEMECAEEYHEPYSIIHQVYLSTKFPVVRVRHITPFDACGLPGQSKLLLGIKTRKNPDDWRGQEEIEVELELRLWNKMYFLQEGQAYKIMKMRRKIGRFDLDTFLSMPLSGLRLLEIELSGPDEQVVIPEGFEVIEVTGNPDFRNENLSMIATSQKLLELIAGVWKN